MKKKIPIIIICIAFIVLVAMLIWILFDKNNMYHVDINNPNLIKTENGYKEELVIEETTIINKYVKEGKIRKRAPNIRKTYNIQYYNDELKEKVTVAVGKEQYDELNIGDRIKVVRTINYTKGGFRINYKDTIEKLD